MRNVLIIAPHPDDEVLGCTSFLGDENVAIIYVTLMHPLFPDKRNQIEKDIIVEALGIKAFAMNGLAKLTNHLDVVPQADLIDGFEKIIAGCQPDIALIPNPSYNQDHRAVYSASLTAMRPHDKNYFVKRILAYEQPETFGTMGVQYSFAPTYYRVVDIKQKVKLLRIYKSQLRGHRSLAHVEAIARLRGMQSNMRHAEAFEVVRWTD